MVLGAPGLGGFVCAVIWAGAPVYVDGDTPCPGAGTDAEPYCDLATALDNVPGGGATIRVRTAALPYAGAIETDDAISGTQATPLVVEADEGHAPVFSERVEFRDVSHVVVRNLTFDGSGLNVDEAALWIRALNVDVDGVELRGNTIVDWELNNNAGAIIVAGQVVDSQLIYAVTNAVVAENRIETTSRRGIRATYAPGIEILDNVIGDVRCWAPDAEATGIRLDNSSSDGAVRGNHIFDVEGCENGESHGISLRSTQRVTVERNLLERVGLGGSGQVNAVFFAGGDDNVFAFNVIDGSGGRGIGIGVPYGSPDRVRVSNNTLVNIASHGIEHSEGGTNVVIENNLVAFVGGAPVRVFDGATGFDIDHNLYFNEEGYAGLWNFGTPVDLKTWQGTCGCDANSIAVEPELLAATGYAGLSPAPGSPAVDAGRETDLRPNVHGDGADIGAFEPPTIVSAIIEAATPDVITVELDNAVAPPLRTAGCAGFSVMVDDAPQAFVDCAPEDADTLHLRADGAFGEGEQVRLAYDGAAVSDALDVGGLVGAHLGPWSGDVTNNAPPRPDGTTTASDTEGDDDPSGTATSDGASATMGGTAPVDPSGGSSGSDAGATAGGADGASGCGCRRRGAGGPGWLFLLVLWVIRRRNH